MAIVTWNGWREHTTEESKEAYDFLTGQNFQPFYKVLPRRKLKVFRLKKTLMEID